jgi:hypothetical protein
MGRVKEDGAELAACRHPALDAANHQPPCIDSYRIYGSPKAILSGLRQGTGRAGLRSSDRQRSEPHLSRQELLMKNVAKIKMN